MTAQSINASAQITGVAPGSEGAGHAFLWQNGTIKDLGTVGTGSYSYGTGINNGGQIAGYAQLANPGYNTQRAVIWQNGAFTNLGDPNLDYSDYSAAYAINSSGDVGGSDHPANGTDNAVVWLSGQPSNEVFLSFLPNLSQHAFVYAINDSGQAAGQIGSDVSHPAVWNLVSGQATDLGIFGGNAGAATAINNDGVVAGWADDASYVPQAFVWQSSTGMVRLGVLPGTGSCQASGINSRGDMVGSCDNGVRAFVYTNGAMHDLTSLLPSNGWLLQTANAINDVGQIVGVGIFGGINGHPAAYLLTPVSAVTSTALATSAGTSVVGQRVTFTATVTPNQSSAIAPTGQVTFFDGSTVMGTAPVTSGAALFTTSALTLGPHNVTALYRGDANFAASTSARSSELVVTAGVHLLVQLTSITRGSDIVATFSTANLGADVATGVTVTISSLNGVATTTVLPLPLGTLASGASNAFTLQYPGTAAAAGSIDLLRFTIHYTESNTGSVGSLNGTVRVTAP
jgi:probable HAF family extracellular repeat protein